MTARVVMVSGANRGIGAAVASEMASAGWRVSMGVRDPGAIRDHALGETARVHRYDAVEAGSAERWVEATHTDWGRIDAVVNNAGVMIPKTVIEASDDDLDTLMDVNVKGPMRVVRAAWPHLIESGQGRVVTVASLSGKRIKTAQSSLYSVSKFAAVALAHAFRHAGFEHGIRSSAICPSFVATDMAKALVEIDPATMTQPEDVARIVRMVIELPNTASIAELPVNCGMEESY